MDQFLIKIYKQKPISDHLRFENWKYNLKNKNIVRKNVIKMPTKICLVKIY